MIPYGKHHLDQSDIDSVVSVLRAGPLTQGYHIEEFEAAVASYVGAKYAVAVSSGTAALHLCAIVAGLNSASTLLTSPITFVSTANAGRYVDATVDFVDVDPETINMSPEHLSDKLQATHCPGVKAVIPVHYAGLPCDMVAIKKVCDEHNAVIIEDAAHALGASYETGEKVGSCAFSLMTIFSFHPVKAIAAGEGGMITTNDEHVYARLLRLRSHGINKNSDALINLELSQTDKQANPWYYEMQELGYHYRLTDIQSALGCSQMKKLDLFISKRAKLVARYAQYFQSASKISSAQENQHALSAHHLYPVRIKFDQLSISRADLMNRLRDKGVGTQVHYLPVPLHPYYAASGQHEYSIPNAIKYYSEALSLPLFYSLTFGEQDYVCESLSELVI